MKNKYKLRSDGRREATKSYDGKIKHFYGKTDAEIDNKIAEYEKSLTEQKKRYFSKVADEYWDEKQKDISINTVHGYEVAVRRVKEEFGDTLIAEIGSHEVYDFLMKFKAQGYSSKVISNTKAVLRGIFDYAFVCGDVDHNPCSGIPAIKGKAKVPRQPASESDIDRIKASKRDGLYGTLFYFLLYTGARLGEALALQQKDIDRNKKTASITKTLAYGNGNEATIKLSPKTEAGIRELQLLDTVLDVLPSYSDPNTYIFFPDGFPSRGVLYKGLDRYRRERGIASTPHQLRHSYASMLHSAGIDVKDAQQLLGHSSVAMTQDIYTHLDKQHKEVVRDTLNNFVNEPTSSVTSSNS